jgi:hypothetical protein
MTGVKKILTQMNNLAAEQRDIRVPLLLCFDASGREFNPQRLKRKITDTFIWVANLRGCDLSATQGFIQ